MSDNLFHAFGDESIGEKHYVYVTIVGQSRDCDILANKIFELKKFHNVFSEIHCKELFHSNRREKTGWDIFKNNDVKDFFSKIIDLISINNISVIAAIGLNKDARMPMELESEDGSISFIKNFTEHSAAMLGAMSNYDFAVRRFGGNIIFYDDPNFNKVPWINGRRQATLALNDFWSDLGSDIGTHKIKRGVIGDREKLLLEAADVSSYLIFHLVQKRESKHYYHFRKLRKKSIYIMQ